MLQGTLAFLVVVALAVIGRELRGVLIRRGLESPALEGLFFLLIGLLLGETVLGLFPADILGSLRVVVLLGLAWIGLVFGVQIEARIVRQLKPWHRRVGLGVPVLIGAVVTACGLVLGVPVALSIALGAIATASSPAPLDALARSRVPSDRGAFRLLRLVKAFAGIPAVVAFAVADAIGVQATDPGDLTAGLLLVYTVGIGLVMGYALLHLIRGVSDQIRLLILVTGTLAAVAGTAAVLGTSGLPAAACAGAVVINRCSFPNRMLRAVHVLEMPMLVALLVLVGASWSGVAFSWRAFAVMTVGRSVAVLLGGRLLAAAARRNRAPLSTPWLGGGLLAQGGLALGLLVATVTVVEGTDGVLEAVIAAMIVNNIGAQLWVRRYLFPRSRA